MHCGRIRCHLKVLERNLPGCSIWSRPIHCSTVSKAEYTGAGTVGGFVHTPMKEGENPIRTVMSPLSEDMQDNKILGIRSYAELGFRLMDNTFLYGPVALFRKTTLSWRVLHPDHIIPDSVAFLTFLVPKLDLLILGPGDKKNIDPVRKRLSPFLKEHKIPFEILSIEEAISTFNYLNNEGRHICALLFPPDDVQTSTSDEMSLNQELGFDLDSIEAIWPEAFEKPPAPGQKLLYSHRDVIDDLWRRELGEAEEKVLTPLEQQRKRMDDLKQRILGSGYTYAVQEKERVEREEGERELQAELEAKEKIKRISDDKEK